MNQPPSHRKLCRKCNQLELGRMLAIEVNERPMGSISHYHSPTCPFCSMIANAIKLASADGWDLTTNSHTKSSPRLFIQSRSPVSVKINGYMHYPGPRLLLAVDQKTDHRQNRRPLREIDRVKGGRYILAEIEQVSNKSMNDGKRDLIRRRTIPTQLNISLMQNWLKQCKTHKHSTAAPKKIGTGPFDSHSFRLIDVAQECLTHQIEKCDYVALSYVWGQSPTILTPHHNLESPILVTTRQNISLLSRPHALSESCRELGKIPRTVSDAMELTRKIGIRYFWVDTLCIVQDDEQDKSRLISHMDDIYDNATITIMATTGDNPDAGLPGISPRAGCPIKPHNVLDETNGHTLSLSLSLPSLCHEVRKGMWSTRGWTFQEQSLSQRCLYFTRNEIFFQCPDVQWREGYDYEDGGPLEAQIQIRTGPPWWSKRLRKDPDPTPYDYLGDPRNGLDAESYQRSVQDYSRRNLTKPEDILNAFEGIFNKFQQVQEGPRVLNISQAQGIPPHLMAQALLWFPSDTCQRRESGEAFSTWSWASWLGPIEFIFAESLWLSRSISHAPRKNSPVHVAVAQWQFGDANSCFWSHRLWQASEDVRKEKEKHKLKDYWITRKFLSDVIGIHVKRLLSKSLGSLQVRLICGQLGFIGAYLGCGDFNIALAGTERIKPLDLPGGHAGQFKYDVKSDSNSFVPATELVIICCTTTIMGLPRTVMVFLGVATRDGVSVRVGVGYTYLSKDTGASKPRWGYRFFVVN
ncbi:HET domain-containing protein [Aspergillus neoniger CBS 115656]|uniref:HET-domain-containing protein n=1 Tax=Aspergillus neoniger (strain CBS 115656) TaxID=1448310 RepID=A0A318YU33_ASPNB|nr:HET-domain-containing protein [Aspergillus neoniger CBS 115656]PYH37814.1 HET-domain-containing protein [Aspergillus neoniger CBS 115656]